MKASSILATPNCSERVKPRLRRKLVWVLAVLAFALPSRLLANTAGEKSLDCLSLRAQIGVSERAAQATVSRIKSAPTKAQWCSYSREYNALYEKHNGLMRDYARCQHLEEQEADYNQLMADYDYNQQRLMSMQGTVAVACAAAGY